MHSRTLTLRGSLPSAITRRQRSRSVTIPTSVPPPFFSTTGSAPACCSFINSAARWAVSSSVQQTGYSCIISDTFMALLLSACCDCRLCIKLQLRPHLPEQAARGLCSGSCMGDFQRRIRFERKRLLLQFFLKPIYGHPQPLIQLRLQLVAGRCLVERLQGFTFLIERNIPARNFIRSLRKWNELEQRAAGARYKLL